MGEPKYPSPNNALRKFFFRVGTEVCADIGDSAAEAEEYADTLGDKHSWYWAGYRDCAAALSETLTRMATDEVKEVVEAICVDWAAAKRERDKISRKSRNTEESVRDGSGEGDDEDLWDNLARSIGPIS